MDWVFSAIMLAYLWFAGYKLWWSWLLAAIGSVIFIVFVIFPTQYWGLLPLEIVALGLYVFNARKWYRDAR